VILVLRSTQHALPTPPCRVGLVLDHGHPVTLATLAKLGKALDLTFMIGSEEAARKAGTNDRA